MVVGHGDLLAVLEQIIGRRTEEEAEMLAMEGEEDHHQIPTTTTSLKRTTGTGDAMVALTTSDTTTVGQTEVIIRTLHHP